MKTISAAIVMIATLVFALASVVHAETRNALVIGNGNYVQVGPLDNPPNDAALMAETLRSLEFNVIELIDATQVDMKRAVRDFGTRLNDAGKDGVGLFYYAGHGLQVGGANYIIPVDAVIDKEGDVDIEALNANSVLRMMEYSKARLSFVVLDACRNNPYSRGFRSATRGLAKMSAPTGSFIAYATSPGDVAADGSGSNSPYTEALVKHMSEPGMPIEKVFRNVRNEVREATNNQQTPWESSSLIGDDYYFKTVVEIESTPAGQEVTVTTTDQSGVSNSVSTAAPANQVAAVTVAQPTGGVRNTGNQNIELLFWDSVKNSQNPAVFQAYIDKYPNGIFVELALLKIQSLVGTKIAAVSQQSAPQQVQKVEQPVVRIQPEPEPEPEPEIVSLAAVVVNPVRPKLNECEAHLKAKRLTSGQGGNALSCYQEVLSMESGHPEAIEGIGKIENTYARWASISIDRNDLKKAERNIRKLRTMNENHQQLAVLDERLAVSLSAAAQQAQQAQQAAQPKAVTKVAAAAKPKVAQKIKKSSSSQCEALYKDGELRGKGGALDCYLDALNANPSDSAASKGVKDVDLAVYNEFRKEIKSKNLRNAELMLRAWRKEYRDSAYIGKMRFLYEELKMESRW